VDKQGQKKFKDARMRQSNFIASMILTKSWELEPNALYDTTSNGFTFRELIMSIRSLKHPKDPLFHTVDQPTNGSQVALFLHHPDDNEQAMQVKAGLLPYMRWRWRTTLQMTFEHLSEAENNFLKPILYKFFTAGAVTTADGMDWDDEAHEVTSGTSDNLAAILDGDEKFKFKVVNLEMQAVLLSEARPKSAVLAKAPKQHRRDTMDSISTMRPTKSALKTTPVKPPAESDISSQSFRTEASASVISGRSDLSAHSSKSGVSFKTSKSTQALHANMETLLENMKLLLEHKEKAEAKIQSIGRRLSAMDLASQSSSITSHPPPTTPPTLLPEARDGENP
jgi:hypothetical protein